MFPVGASTQCIIDPAAPASLADVTIQTGFMGSVVVNRNLTVTNQVSSTSVQGALSINPGITVTARLVNVTQGGHLSGGAHYRSPPMPEVQGR